MEVGRVVRGFIVVKVRDDSGNIGGEMLVNG